MIRLSIPDFCQNCPDFDAYVEKYEYNNTCQTSITCEHLERCRNIKLRIENQMTEKNKSETDCSNCGYRKMYMNDH